MGSKGAEMVSWVKKCSGQGLEVRHRGMVGVTPASVVRIGCGFDVFIGCRDDQLGEKSAVGRVLRCDTEGWLGSCLQVL